jgi:hypothetical protein
MFAFLLLFKIQVCSSDQGYLSVGECLTSSLDCTIEPGSSCLFSTNCQYVLIMAHSGDLILRKLSNFGEFDGDSTETLFTSETSGNDGENTACLEENHNFVVRSESGNWLWATNTADSSGPCNFHMWKNGVAQLWCGSEEVVWSEEVVVVWKTNTWIQPNGESICPPTPSPIPSPTPLPTATSNAAQTPSCIDPFLRNREKTCGIVQHSFRGCDKFVSDDGSQAFNCKYSCMCKGACGVCDCQCQASPEEL